MVHEPSKIFILKFIYVTGKSRSMEIKELLCDNPHIGIFYTRQPELTEKLSGSEKKPLSFSRVQRLYITDHMKTQSNSNSNKIRSMLIHNILRLRMYRCVCRVIQILDKTNVIQIACTFREIKWIFRTSISLETEKHSDKRKAQHSNLLM